MPETLKFYDLKRRKSFTTSNYKIVTDRTKTGKIRRRAVTTAPSGAKATVFMKSK